MSGDKGIQEKIDKSAVMTVIGVILLFSAAVVVTLIAPGFVDRSWVEPSSEYQQQMYEIADPHIYISNESTGSRDLKMVYHLKQGFSLIAFVETETIRMIASDELRPYITRFGDSNLKLTSDIILLRSPDDENAQAAQVRNQLQSEWESRYPNWRNENQQKPRFTVLELYKPEKEEAFVVATSDGITENWVDENYTIVDTNFPRTPYHADSGVLYTKNPEEYRISYFKYGALEGYKYDPNGEPVESVDKLVSKDLGFLSRADLIQLGEDIYRVEGCWYCHTDQTRTLVQDTVLNGSDSYPAPPSSANEYVYQQVTFPGTRRIGPDLSRVGIKRPGRDWHMSHFWSPKTESAGTIMPSFQYFFDNDPAGTSKSPYGVPNYKFEAIYQYLMTKGTRITPPTQAWWLGKDPVRTIDIIEGKARMNDQEVSNR